MSLQTVVDHIIVHGNTPLTHHPQLPTVRLRAGAVLRHGSVCWIDEDGQVYPIAVLADWRGPLDGVADATYAAGQPCQLLTQVCVCNGWKFYY